MAQNNNDKNEDGKYPPWVTCLFDGHTKCKQCGKPLKLDDIVSIGVFSPNYFGGEDVGPRSTVTVRCEYCGQDLHITTNADVPQLLQGVEALYDVIAGERMEPTSPWYDLPNPNGDRFTNQYAPKTPNESTAKRIARIKRLKARPSEREVRAFLNRLAESPGAMKGLYSFCFLKCDLVLNFSITAFSSIDSLTCVPSANERRRNRASLSALW